MSDVREKFKAAVRGERIRPAPVEDEDDSFILPGVTRRDGDFILRAMGRTRPPREFYGPGAEAARQRQAEAQAPPKEAAKPTPKKPTIRERLRALRERIENERNR